MISYGEDPNIEDRIRDALIDVFDISNAIKFDNLIGDALTDQEGPMQEVYRAKVKRRVGLAPIEWAETPHGKIQAALSAAEEHYVVLDNPDTHNHITMMESATVLGRLEHTIGQMILRQVYDYFQADARRAAEEPSADFDYSI